MDVWRNLCQLLIFLKMTVGSFVYFIMPKNNFYVVTWRVSYLWYDEWSLSCNTHTQKWNLFIFLIDFLRFFKFGYFNYRTTSFVKEKRYFIQITDYRYYILVSFPSHLKKLRSILRFWFEKLNCGFFHSFYSWKTTFLHECMRKREI